MHLGARNNLKRATRASLEDFKIGQNEQKKGLSLDSIAGILPTAMDSRASSEEGGHTKACFDSHLATFFCNSFAGAGY
jgi:hypothetical protein